ncbi:MAG TPA: DUF481 domain-containing protein [Chitinophagaceae bacterium]|nr:DUF481 domain-containing protein [Chitinophagaceae bacterium]
MRKAAFFLPLLTGCLFAFQSSHAQIINIESSRIQSDTLGWAGSAGANFALVKNTRQILLVNLQAHLQLKTEKSLWLILGDYGFLQGGDDKYISNSFGHIRYNRKINKWLRWEAFTQVQSNLITRIESRFLAGTGPRFKVMSFEKFRLYAASLIMYEFEKERTTPASNINKNIRSSSYISFTFVPSDNTELINTTFFQPRFGHFSDNRVFSQTSLKVKASKRFSLNIRYNYLHDRVPAKGAPATTYNLSSGIEIDF